MERPPTAVKYVLKVCYEGSAFAGFQRQTTARTVQGQLEKALSKIFQEPIELVAAGRTDTGVHGLGQVVAFRSHKRRPLKGVVEGLNGALAPSAAILEAALLPHDHPFHPRFDALSRTYSYYLLSECERSSAVLCSQRMWCLGGALDPERVQSAAQLFIGRHDFSTFTAKSEVPHRRREVYEITHQVGDAVGFSSGRLSEIRITAEGFLRRMVRLLVAGIVEVGLGLTEVAELQQKLEWRDPGKAPHPAPAAGLYFRSVQFESDPFSAQGPALEHYLARQHLGRPCKSKT